MAKLLGKVLKRGARAVVGEIPGASLAMEGLGLAKDIKKTSPTPRQPRQSRTIEYIELALKKGG